MAARLKTNKLTATVGTVVKEETFFVQNLGAVVAHQIVQIIEECVLCSWKTPFILALLML